MGLEGVAGVHVQEVVIVEEVFVAAFVVAFAILSLYDPNLYRKLFAPLCSMPEDDLPPFPRSAALALLLFFGLVVLAPGVLRVAGAHIWIPQRFLDWLVVIAFLIVGFGLAVSPEGVSSHPQMASTQGIHLRCRC